MGRAHKFRQAIVEKRWDDAWDIATDFWGTPEQERAVLFEMLKELLKNQKA